MNQSNKHSVAFQCITAVLILALLTPSFVKLAHVFQNHTHEICIDFQKTHLHEFDVDCEFYKFKLNTQFTHHPAAIELLVLESNFQVYGSQYQYLSEFQRLQFLLRGPPVLV